LTAFMVVGALIVAHRPSNAIGWIFTAIGLLAATGLPAGEYVTYIYWTRSGSLPAAILVAWALLGGAWYPTMALALVFTPLLFPTGHLLSPRWRPVAWLAGAATAAFTVLATLQPNLARAPGRVIANPIGVAAVGNLEESRVGVALLSLQGSVTVAVCTQCPSMPAAGTYLPTWINAAMWRWLVMWASDE
jgi:hypothetical protein